MLNGSSKHCMLLSADDSVLGRHCQQTFMWYDHMTYCECCCFLDGLYCDLIFVLSLLSLSIGQALKLKLLFPLAPPSDSAVSTPLAQRNVCFATSLICDISLLNLQTGGSSRRQPRVFQRDALVNNPSHLSRAVFTLGFGCRPRHNQSSCLRCECLVFSLDIPSNFSPLTKLPTAFCSEWRLRSRSKDLIWKCWSCMQTRGCYETIAFVWHTIAFQPLGNSLDLHRTGITFMLSDTEGNRVTNFSESLHTFNSFTPLLFHSRWIGTLFHILLKWCQAILTAAALIRPTICGVYANGYELTGGAHPSRWLQLSHVLNMRQTIVEHCVVFSPCN